MIMLEIFSISGILRLMPPPNFSPTPADRGPLGLYLWDTRQALGLSLRDAHAATGVSNAYINQMETGKITQPSPSILQKIAEGYKAPYKHLMELAGHIKKESTTSKRRGVLPTSTLANVELSREEEEEVRQFISFLKMRNRKNDENK